MSLQRCHQSGDLSLVVAQPVRHVLGRPRRTRLGQLREVDLRDMALHVWDDYGRYRWRLQRGQHLAQAAACAGGGLCGLLQRFGSPRIRRPQPGEQLRQRLPMLVVRSVVCSHSFRIEEPYGRAPSRHAALPEASVPVTRPAATTTYATCAPGRANGTLRWRSGWHGHRGRTAVGPAAATSRHVTSSRATTALRKQRVPSRPGQRTAARSKRRRSPRTSPSSARIR